MAGAALAGSLYHDGREDIFRALGDRRVFVDVLAGVWGRFNWIIHAYCLMTNHYHLLVETPDGNLGKGMRELNGVYTQRLKRVCQQTGDEQGMREPWTENRGQTTVPP